MNTQRSATLGVAHRFLLVGLAVFFWYDVACPAFAQPTDPSDRIAPAQTRTKHVARCPRSPVAVAGAQPRIGDYSNSGCLDELDGDPDGVYPFCGDDRMDLTPGPGSIHLLHANATYNCCITEVRFHLSMAGGVIHLMEEERLDGFGCDCMCCYDLEVTVVDLPPDSYTVELCWWDWEESGLRCIIQHDVVIPPAVGACCQDISDGPIPYETCYDTAPADCPGVFHPESSCQEAQACCLEADLCQDLNPYCCMDSGGVSMGSGSTCTDVEACPQLCDGLGSRPPCPNDAFCEFPPGTCDDGTVTGACVTIPETCPEYADPVCGCDGVTYDNECFAEMAAVSIAYWGFCETPHCAGSRNLSTPTPTFCPGVPKEVQVHLSPRPGATSYSIEDAPPDGWEVVFISHDGSFDEVNGKVKWGPLFLDDPGFPRSVSYTVVSPDSANSVACFDGAVSVDGFNEPICGDRCIFERCCTLMSADLPRPPCVACAFDCASCADSACGDGRISMCELTSYACAWLVGCHDDMAGMTRAAYVWKTGECYCHDAADGVWHSTSCPPPASGCCGD